MGGKPLTALAIACFPKPDAEGSGSKIIPAVFRGGLDKLREAGVALLGGHTVQDAEIKFGYAVTGVIDPARLWVNAGAKAGDTLLITKPVGTGVATTAAKHSRAPDALISEVTRSMQALNKSAAEVLISANAPVHACTDITGFGLLGHISEVARASNVSVEIVASQVPLFRDVLAQVARNRTGGMISNRNHFGSSIAVAEGIPGDLVDLFYDPQTSGGLLVFIAHDASDAGLRDLRAAGVSAHAIGRVVESAGQLISLV
jgi:selenide,water dikinase